MDGAAKVYPLGELTAIEERLLKEAIGELKRNIEGALHSSMKRKIC